MGLRGPGARPTKKKPAKGKKKAPQAVEPWKAEGLTRAGRVIAFLESLPVTKGIAAGQCMKLLPNQVEFIRKTYTDDYSVRIAINSAPRGNGKTGLTAGLALCHMLGPESEPRGEIYVAGIDKTQSSKLFAEVEATIAAVPEFAERTNVQRFIKKIEVMEGDGAGSVLEAMSADGRKANGLAPSLWIFDELAQVADTELLDNLETGLGKRHHSLGIVISTQAESDDHRLSKMIDDALTGADPSVVCHLIAAPPDADPFDEAVLRSVNPAIDVFLNAKDLLADMAKAARIPAFEARFRNRRLNQRVDQNVEHRIVTVKIWDQCAEPVDRAALKGRTCFGGLDLSAKHDLTALVLAFPSDDAEPTYDILPIIWTPLDQLAARQARERENFDLWLRQGHIIGVPGPVIRSSWIAEELGRLSAEFDIQAIAFDRWRVDDLRQDLADAGSRVMLEPRGQGFRDQGPDVEVLTELALTGRIRHGNHPVLRAAMAGAILVPDAAGNHKIDKDVSNRRSAVRIDPAVALAMALGLASRTPPKRQSVYATRGLIAV